MVDILFEILKKNPDLAQGTIAFIVPRIVEGIKRATWVKGVDQDTTGINRALAVAMGLFTSIGITASGSMDAGWVITIPALPILIEGGMRVIFQLGLQETFYKTTVKDQPGIVMSLFQIVGGRIRKKVAGPTE